MRFNEFAKTMSIVRYQYGLDDLDIEMIRQVVRIKELDGEARIMAVVATNCYEGKTTAHNRVSNLIKRGFLKVYYGKDGRIKLLELGSFALEMMNDLWEEKEYIH